MLLFYNPLRGKWIKIFLNASKEKYYVQAKEML
jgi:hypothetical protein